MARISGGGLGFSIPSLTALHNDLISASRYRPVTRIFVRENDVHTAAESHLGGGGGMTLCTHTHTINLLHTNTHTPAVS